MSIKMIAGRRYYSKAEGREYAPGQSFTVASDREADRLEKMQRARRDSGETRTAPAHRPAMVDSTRPHPLDHDNSGRPGGSMAPDGAAGDIAALRAEYQKVFDKKPFPGWDVETLRAKIAAHGGGAYQRRDMRAED